MKVEERMESRIQLQAIYTCAGQLPSHNRACAQLPNINRLVILLKIVTVKKTSVPCEFEKPNVHNTKRKAQRVNQVRV